MTMPEVEDCYEWMFQSETDDDNLEQFRDLREGIEKLTETGASFRLKDVTDYHPSHFNPEMMWMLGSWEMPERVTTSRVTRWVNPNYVHKRTYADIVVECECGAVVGRERDKGSWEGENNHAEKEVDTEADEWVCDECGEVFEDIHRYYGHFSTGHETGPVGCRASWREDAKTRLIARRKWWIEQAARLHLTVNGVAPRMGVSHKSVVPMCERYGIDWDTLRKEGRKRKILTWRKLHDDYDYTWREIAEAFGRPSSTVRSYANGCGRNINV